MIKWYDLIDVFIYVIEVEEIFDLMRDVADSKFIDCAMAGTAEFLITGDKDFSDILKIGNTKIVSVSVFKRLFLD